MITLAAVLSLGDTVRINCHCKLRRADAKVSL
jgi:hypothetical protein